MEAVSNNATLSYSYLPSTPKDIGSLPSGHSNKNRGAIHVFDCAICYESLTKPGPPLNNFTFGKLLINVCQLPYLEREHIHREFQLIDQCFSNGYFDCDKIVATPCGHLFHSGCIREWFFMKRLDRNPKCPFCNRRTCYEECRILHPLACDPNDKDDSSEDEEQDLRANFHETEYSDISCTSSSWPTDEESSTSDDDDDDLENEPEEQNNRLENVDDELINENDLIDQDDFAEDLDNLSTSSSNYILQRCDDDILYYPVYIGKRSNAGKSSFEKVTKAIHFIRSFVLDPVAAANVCSGACQLYQWKKNRFVAETESSIENIEDEQMANINYEDLVPLGYEFIGLLLAVAMFIFAEEWYFSIYQRKRGRRISAPVILLHLLTFIAFASLFLLISRAILFT